MTGRRALLAGGAAAAIGVGASGYALTRDAYQGEAMDPEAVHGAAVAGEVVLLDIRRPEEWEATGVGVGAEPLDMRRADFLEAASALLGGDRSRPVALICARGVRSDRAAARLVEAGFTHVIDVPEGMLGSDAGPGWLGRGLPAGRPLPVAQPAPASRP